MLLEGVDVIDGKARPATFPPEGFHWQFLAIFWVLDPVMVDKETDKGMEISEPHVSETEDLNEEYASDDSIFEFERLLRELMPGLKGGSSSRSIDAPKGVRKSERQ